VSDEDVLPPDFDPDEMMTVTEVTRRVRRTSRTLWNWEQTRLLVPLRIQGQRRGPRLYRRADVEALLSNGVP
jgi:DNA-binding transcriptional MerR regulator